MPRPLLVEPLEDRTAPAVLGQLRVVSYNVLRVPDTAATTTVLQAINDSTRAGLARDIDIILLQEVDNAGTDDDIIRNILNAAPGSSGQYVAGPLGGSDGSIRPGVVYNDATVDFLGSQIIASSGPRDPIRYQFRPQGLDSTYDFFIYNSHYDAVDAPDRLNEAQNIRANADALGQGAEILYAGDFNIDSSSEGMYTTLLGAGNGQAFDPINTPGTWHESNALRGTHTQAPGPNFIGGGMDDRFDFILHSQEVGATGTAGDGTGLEYRAGSYWAFGNTGTHPLNGNIDQGTGAAPAVLTALMAASDHLPVVSDYDIVSPDNTPPTLLSIDDGDADNLVAANAALTYTVTFSEDILNGSFTAADLNNAGTAALSFGTITETSPGVFTVQVTPTAGGTLTLRIPAGAVVLDTAGNALAVPVQDNDTLTVDATAPAIAPANFVDNAAGGPVAVNAPVTYTLTFSEDILNGSFTAADLNNAGTAAVAIGAITETSPGVFTVVVTPTTTGTLTLRIPTGAVVEDVVGNDLAVPVQDDTTITVTPAAPAVLQVAALTPTHSGFVADFTRPLDPADLNLYDSAAGLLGAADATLTGPGGAVRGSLVVDPGLTRVTFVATGGALAAGSYTVALRSAANGFKDTSAGLLDGDANGVAGGDYATGFTVTSTARVVSVPDFARGGSQPVNVPANATGLPLRVSDAAGVTGVQADLLFDAALLTIPTGTFPAAFGGTLTVTAIAGGVRLTVTGLTGATGPNATVAAVGASVPAAAPYASKQVLAVRNVSVNGGAIAARGDDAVHVAAYFGDATGNGGLSGQDAALVSQVAAVLATGYAAYQNADPVIVTDATGNGALSGQDAALVSVRATGQTVPQIPDLPGVPPPPAGGPDPRLYLTSAAARPGETVTVQLRMEVTEPGGVAVTSGDYAVRFDPTRLRVSNVRAGAMLAGFGLAANVDNAAGTIRVTQFAATPRAFAFGADGAVVLFDVTVRDGARPGRAALNLVEQITGNGTTTRTGLANDAGALTLVPAPTDRADDPVDGAVTVRGRRAARDVPRAGAPDRPAGFAPPADDGPARVGRVRAAPRT